MDKVQKVSNCISIPSSQTFRSYLSDNTVRCGHGDNIRLAREMEYVDPITRFRNIWHKIPYRHCDITLLNPEIVTQVSD
jgi:hypothetical protein